MFSIYNLAKTGMKCEQKKHNDIVTMFSSQAHPSLAQMMTDVLRLRPSAFLSLSQEFPPLRGSPPWTGETPRFLLMTSFPPLEWLGCYKSLPILELSVHFPTPVLTPGSFLFLSFPFFLSLFFVIFSSWFFCFQRFENKFRIFISMFPLWLPSFLPPVSCLFLPLALVDGDECHLLLDAAQIWLESFVGVQTWIIPGWLSLLIRHCDFLLRTWLTEECQQQEERHDAHHYQMFVYWLSVWDWGSDHDLEKKKVTNTICKQ